MPIIRPTYRRLFIPNCVFYVPSIENGLSGIRTAELGDNSRRKSDRRKSE